MLHCTLHHFGILWNIITVRYYNLYPNIDHILLLCQHVSLIVIIN